MDFERLREKWNNISFGDRMAALAVVFILVMSYFYVQEQEAIKAKRSADNLKREERLSAKKNVVVLGVDQLMEAGDGQRSDTLFIMMFDPEKRQCSLLNVPRDTRVQMEIEGKPDFRKVNDAYTQGGIRLTMSTLEEFLGLRIDHYLIIDVSGFKRVVDAIGGVDLYVDRDMDYDDFKQGLHIHLKAGQQHLDGERAMQYVRFRREYGDIGRIRRQQRFLWAVQRKLVSGQMLFKIPGLTKELVSMVKTNLSISDILPMVRTLRDMVQENAFYMSYIPGTAEYLYDIGYWTPHVVDTRRQMAELQGVPFEGKLLESANRLAEVYNASVAKGRDWQAEHDAMEEEKLRHPQVENLKEQQNTEAVGKAEPVIEKSKVQTVEEKPKKQKSKKHGKKNKVKTKA
ncbi:MAG: LCP family protein [Acidaminococcaceae bacterium]|nr:LCP family protein [Acidaminococcaceae bacterium]